MLIKKISVKLKSVIYLLLLLIFGLISISCSSVLYIGIPDTYKGYYISTEAINQGDYLHFRVFNGGFSMWFGDPSEQDAYGLDMIRPDYIIGNGYAFSFDTHNISGTISFVESRAIVTFIKNTEPLFSVYEVTCVMYKQ